MKSQELLAPIMQFLACETPDAWVDEACKTHNLPIILRDHLLCELKAAQSAAFLLSRYVLAEEGKREIANLLKPYEAFAYRREGSLESLKGKNTLSKRIKCKEDCHYGQEMLDKMVLLIKEELHHFYQVLEIIETRNIGYQPISAGRYAKTMMKSVRTFEPQALVDKLIIGAFIEARSCERFAKLAPFLDAPLHNFYISLLRSEARHYQDYLELAALISSSAIDERVTFFAALEADLINTIDLEFRFHSGIPERV